MKLPLLATAILIGAAIAPLAHAAGQPELSKQENAAATEGRPAAQAEQSKMDVKRERDATKYQDQAAEKANQPKKD